MQLSLSLNEFLFQLAEVICEETALRQENRKMSVIIAEAQTVTHHHQQHHHHPQYPHHHLREGFANKVREILAFPGRGEGF